MTRAPSPTPPDNGPAGEVWFAAGGTGGHIYPALEVGRALGRAAPGLTIRFLCGARPGELKIYHDHGIDPVVLPMTGRRPGVRNQLRFLKELFAAGRQCRRMAQDQRPRLAVGFGGYPSAPALWAARLAGAVTLIQEQNAFPGLANRLLARRAARIYAGLPIRHPAFGPEKTTVTGNPVRRELLETGDRSEARRHFGIAEDTRLVLAFGGSLGAAGLNTLILQALESHSARRWRWLWSTGPDHLETVKRRLAEIEGGTEQVEARPYLGEMNLAYAAADLVVCRAGALTLAELAALGKPSILVPLPTSASDHQRANARRFESEGAAVLVEQGDAAAGQKIVTCLEQFESDCDKLEALGEAARRLGHPDAAREIVIDILRFLQ